jgi:hypothetical protein
MRLRTLALLAAFLLPLPLAANNITYNVDLTIGTGTVTGFIQTDGAQGFLGYFDVVSWNLEMTSPAGSYDIYGLSSGHQPSNSQLIESGYGNGGALIGTPTELEFSFTGQASEVSFSPGAYPGPADAVNFFEEGGGGPGGAGEYFVFAGVPEQSTRLSGTQVIGAVPTPEGGPSFAFLLMSGASLCGAALFRFRKRPEPLTV